MLVALGVFFTLQVHAQNVTAGAYYFDGWKNLRSRHLTPALRDTFSEREPIWGWITSTQNIMNEQINLAADAGLSFFSFCWYYNPKRNVDSSNRALVYYLASPVRQRLRFNLMVANHKGYEIGPREWPAVVQEWLQKFKSDTYLKVDGKPLLTFFTITTLVSKFGSPDAVRQAFDSLRTAAQQQGLGGVTIALCTGPGKRSATLAAACGFDVLTGYNYHDIGLADAATQAVPIDKMIRAENNLWNRFPKVSTLPYMPVATLNWDPRPWARPSNRYASKPYFTGFSAASVAKSVRSASNWVRQHPQHTLKEKVVLLYAWNEYGEGAWLTPSKQNGNKLLAGVKQGLQ